MDQTETFDFRGDAVRWGTTGNGPPLVLLHGTPFSSVVRRRIVPHLAQHPTGVRLRPRRLRPLRDARGPGRLARRPEPAVRGAARPLGARPTDVVAHDFGGATALRTHLLGERDYRTLTLIDPVALSPHGSALVQAARRHADAYAELPADVHEAACPGRPASPRSTPTRSCTPTSAGRRRGRAGCALSTPTSSGPPDPTSRRPRPTRRWSSTTASGGRWPPSPATAGSHGLVAQALASDPGAPHRYLTGPLAAVRTIRRLEVTQVLRTVEGGALRAGEQ